MHSLILGLGFCLVLGSITTVLTFAGINRVIRDLNAVADELINAQNATASRVTDLTATVTHGIDCLIRQDADTSAEVHEQ